MIQMHSVFNHEPSAVERGPTISIYRDGIARTDETDPESGTVTVWECDEARLTPAEDAAMLEGRWAGPWTPAMHRAFRQHQHDRTLSLYDMARRKSRRDASWNAYIADLDAWNDAVSALADGYGTDVPPLPPEPE